MNSFDVPDSPETRFARFETDLRHALRDIDHQSKRIEDLALRSESNRTEITKHSERIDDLRHDFRNMRMTVTEAQDAVTKMGRAAYDLVAEEHKARNEAIGKERDARHQDMQRIERERVAALEKISVTIAQAERERREQINTLFKRVFHGAWVLATIVFAAYMGTVFI